MKRRNFLKLPMIPIAAMLPVIPIAKTKFSWSHDKKMVIGSWKTKQLDDETILLYAKLKASAYGQDTTYIRKYFNETKGLLIDEIIKETNGS